MCAAGRRLERNAGAHLHLRYTLAASLSPAPHSVAGLHEPGDALRSTRSCGIPKPRRGVQQALAKLGCKTGCQVYRVVNKAKNTPIDCTARLRLQTLEQRI